MTSIEIVNAHIANSIERALRAESYLDPDVLQIHGFATPTIRHLFSNLCHVEGISYLECGVFAGATFVSAYNNNPIHAVGIDNFSQPFEEQGVRYQLADNLLNPIWKATAKSVRFLDGDCFNLEPLDQRELSQHKPFDIFYYDGEHSETSQARALPEFFKYMADRFIFIVDDYHWDSVRNGTQAGFDALAGQLKIENEWTLDGEQSNDDAIWWNGMALFLISKVKP